MTIAHQFTYLTDDISYKRGWAGIGHSTAFKDEEQWFFASHYQALYGSSSFLSYLEDAFVNDWPVMN